MDDGELCLAGRRVADAEDRVRRYCGMAWSGGGSETWAWSYYDAVVTGPDQLEPVDLLACAALHPGLSRQDLSFFADQRNSLGDYLRTLPKDIDLCDVDDDTLHRILSLSDTAGEASLSLLTKVVHRKRPRLVPILDKAVLDWYRPVTGGRGAAAWRPFVEALRDDVGVPSNRHVLASISGRVEQALGTTGPSLIRTADIAIWMGSR